MSKEMVKIGVKGSVKIEDDTGKVLLEQDNAVHPQNLSRIIARALSGEPNSKVYKLALGNGGTYIDATGATSFRRPNDGISPDLAGWQSRLYNETYNEVVDEGSPLLGHGEGTSPGGDGTGIDGVRSVKLPTGESQIIVTCVLNSQEPSSQLSNSLISTTSAYTFDELGLFTAGLPPVATQGYQDVVLIGGKQYSDITHLQPYNPADSSTHYRFKVTVDGIPKTIDLTLPIGTGASGAITYTDLKQAIDSARTIDDQPLGFVVQVTQPGVNTLGNLRLRSLTAGANSAIVINDMSADAAGLAGKTWLFPKLLSAANSTTAYLGLGTSYTGQPQGEEDNPTYPQNERERMLTHLIFSPLQKDASRSWKITYKITVVVQQSDPAN